jgi:DMSO/TMAO reductase YedYZ molybdopterin-dependent catalytic subunit
MIVQEIERLLVRADEVHKAAASRADRSKVNSQVRGLLEGARELLDEVDDLGRRRQLAEQIAMRATELDQAGAAPVSRAAPTRRAPTSGVDPARIPPGQHLSAGFPVLHVGSAPTSDPASWRLKVTGLVQQRLTLDRDAFLALPRVTSTSDFHCVTGWSRLDNTWTGVRVRDVLRQAGVKPTATHALVYGHPAYSANLDLDVLLDDDVLLATGHDGEPLSAEHGGPVRLVVPQRYGWKSVKWVTDLQLLDRDVRGYWEQRGYHDVADPFLEQRYRGT